jgi:hypothetical protein
MTIPGYEAVCLKPSDWRLIRQRVTEGLGKPPTSSQFRFFMKRVAMLARQYRFQHQLKTGLSPGSMRASLNRLQSAAVTFSKALAEMDGYTPIFLGQFLGRNFGVPDLSKQLDEQVIPALADAIKFMANPAEVLARMPSELADSLNNLLFDRFGPRQVIFFLAIAFRNSFGVMPVCRRDRIEDTYEGNFYGVAVAVTQLLVEGVDGKPLSPLTVGKYASAAVSDLTESGLFPARGPDSPSGRGKRRYSKRT